MRRFWTDREGNIALVFALAAVPIFGAMGVAIDYSMASAYRADIQKSLDATALALTKIMPTDQATLDTVGNQFFQANLNNHNLSNLQLTIQPDVGRLRVSASGTYNVQMANIIGAGTIDLSASAEAKWNIGKVEIALALDNSWSMNSLGRMIELKKAANNLLDVLQNAAKEEGDAKVAIIPFDARVNVGTDNVAATWLKWDVSTSSNGVCSKSQYETQNSCTSNSGVWTKTNAENWGGCVWDRDKNNDTTDASPADAATYYPAWHCNHFIAQSPNLIVPLLPLTTSWGESDSDDVTTLRGKIKQMQPSGYTNLTIGLAWAWHALSQGGVLAEGAEDGAENRQKYIILLSDGDNTRNRFSDSELTMNSRTRKVCDNIHALEKPDGTPLIKVYAIRLINGDAALLSYCASEPDMYKEVENANELSSIFSAIGSEIASLHLSK
jgi:Flp pilus assembly protein TadG